MADIISARNIWLVTVKLDKNPEHNPRKKQAGPCPLTGKDCTDTTGEHHTKLVIAETEERVRYMYKHYHVTRIERA
jgi:hypothetical protein